MEERVWHKAYAPGVPTTIDYERITLPAALERTVGRFPDRVALIMMGRRITFRELDELVNRFANALADLGVKKGDKVALSMPNMPQMVVAAYAVFRLGGVVVMNNPLYTERELLHQFVDSGVVCCICMDLLVPRILKLQPETAIRTIVACHLRDYLPFPIKQLFPLLKKKMHRKVGPGEDVYDYADLIKRYPPTKPEAAVAWEDLAALLYTGGTTGVSKGVMLTHANCCIVVQQLRAWIPSAKDGEETLIAIFPFFHVAGFTAMMNQSMYAGFTQILVPRPRTQNRAGHDAEVPPHLFRVRAHHLCGSAEPAGIREGGFFLYHRMPFRGRTACHGDHKGVRKGRWRHHRGGLRHDRVHDPVPCEPLGRGDQGGQRGPSHPRYGLPHRRSGNR